MRLIDADTTKINLDELQETSDPRINALKLLMVLCVEHTLSDAPTIDAEPVRHGHWIESPNITGCFVCSSCLSDDLSAQVVAPVPKWYRYCPSCGARMDEEAKQ